MSDSETKQCQSCKQNFTIDVEDFDFYKKIDVPPPTWCPECREIRRIAFRNERALYKRKCDMCGNSVVSRISPDKEIKMYCKECWWSDKWDSMSFGKEYDFSRTFFSQFEELLKKIPHISIFNSNAVMSDWVNQETDDKNCYLNVGGHYNENSAYNTYELFGKDAFDNFWLLNSEFAYDSINCKKSYKIVGSEDCLECRDAYFCRDCKNCSNVFGCAGLRNKQYVIFNEQKNKEEYEKFISENNLGNYEKYNEMDKKSREVWMQIPHKYASIQKSVNCSGNILDESKEAKNCWMAEKTENAKNIFIGGWLKDSYDETSHGASELSYECSSGGGVYDSKFMAYCMGNDPLKKMHSLHMQYCFMCLDSENCFGCVGLKNKKYCIMNRQYSEEEYKNMLAKIIEQMNTMPYSSKNGIMYKYGEFFPPELSPFGYNETAAMDYYPLTKEEAMRNGYNWSDYESEIKYEFSDYEIPMDIKDVKDDILNMVLKCASSGKAYKIIPMELEFLRRMNLPIPRKSPLERHKERIMRIPPRKLWHRSCMKEGCTNEFQTSYSPERKEIIYCEECYQAEIA